MSLLLPAWASGATVPPGMFGMQDWKPPDATMMSPVHDAGLGRWRAPIFWNRVETTKGTYDWSRYDAAVRASAESHMPLMLIILGCPAWACPDGVEPPRSGEAVDAQRAFVDAAVRRYKPGGSFWTDNPGLSPQPVTEWQVWNEVNYSQYWKPAPDAAEYASFLNDEAATIRAADPNATVVLSGLNDVQAPYAADFLSELYKQPDFKSSFDVMAVHAYARDVNGVAALLDRVHKVQEDNDDLARRTWITEIGWGTTNGGTTEAQQATRLRQSFDMAIGCKDRWNLDRVYWFAYADISPTAAGATTDNAGYHTGLKRTNGTAKPAWSALQDYKAGAALPGARGDACVIPPAEPAAAAKAPAATARAPAAAPGAALASLTGFRAVAPQTAIFARRRQGHARRAKLAFASSARGGFQCRLLRGRHRKRWRRCGRRYRTGRLGRGRSRLQVRATAGGVADPSPAEARLSLTRGRLTVATSVH